MTPPEQRARDYLSKTAEAILICHCDNVEDLFNLHGEELTTLFSKADERDEKVKMLKRESDVALAFQKESNYHKDMWEGQINRTKMAEAERDSYKEKAKALDWLEKNGAWSLFLLGEGLVCKLAQTKDKSLLSAIQNAAKKGKV